MMYSNKIAVALKSANGKILREFGETVYVPFGEEYSVFVKNLNNVRALISISIDGKDIGDGTKFIVESNSSLNIERFLKEGNMNAGNRLKFIERNAAVENHRGIGVEDGIVRVECWFEKIMPVYKPTPAWIYGDDELFRNYKVGSSNDPNIYKSNVTYSTSEIKTGGLKTRGISGSSMTLNSVGTIQSSVNDAGITVEGSISKQQFTTGAWFPTESTSHVIVLKMLGQTADNTKVKTAVTTRAKPTCKTCGRLNKNSASFCSHCGTALTIL